MIIFGYKNKFSGLIRAILALAVGVVMVVSKTNALELAVRIIAAFLVATGIVTFFVGLKARQRGETSLLGVNAGVDIFLGLLLFFFPSFVVNIMIYIIGFALLVFGIFQLIALVGVVRAAHLRLTSFIMPALVVVAGGFLIARPAFIGETIGVIAGISLILYGISELLSTWKMRKVMSNVDDQTIDDQTIDEQ